MTLYPLALRLSGRRVLVVGGGAVATRRVPALLDAGAEVVVVSPELTPALRDRADAGRLSWIARRFEPADVDGAWLVHVAVNDPAAADEVSAAAVERRVFCVRADDRDAATAWTPAVARYGPLTVAVLGGGDPRRAMAVRDAIRNGLIDGSLPGGPVPSANGATPISGATPASGPDAVAGGVTPASGADAVAGGVTPASGADAVAGGVTPASGADAVAGGVTPASGADAVAGGADAGPGGTTSAEPAAFADVAGAGTDDAVTGVADDAVTGASDAGGEGVPAARPVGRVALVGAGPGDPELITVRGRRLLAEADVVVADRLVPGLLLDELRPDVELVDATKIPHGPAATQEEINRVLVDRALAGATVVRLKGGDPYVFGRGGEELLACTAAGIPVTVVPGVTSSIAAPAAAGIPVTHRGVAHEFTVVSGHLPPDHPNSLVDWSALARLRGTLVVLMGLNNLAAIAAALRAYGRDPQTPAAVVQEGTTGAQRVLRSTLDAVAADVVAAGVRPPAVVVFGPVVTTLTTQTGQPVGAA